MTNGQAALDYATNRGWRVFRIKPGQKIPQDRWVHGDLDERATNMAAEVARRWAEKPDANIGIATGNGLAVLDIDVHHGGARPDWAPETLTARTPNGGYHLYYDVAGIVVPNSAGQLGRGVDVRGDGGMVVAPPSVIETAASAYVDGPAPTLHYEWINAGTPVASIDPARLLPSRPAHRGPKLARATFGEGDRHEAMVSLAGTMRSKGAEYPEIAAALHALNRSRFVPVLEDEWVEKVARSIVAYAPDHDLVRS